MFLNEHRFTNCVQVCSFSTEYTAEQEVTAVSTAYLNALGGVVNALEHVEADLRDLGVVRLRLADLAQDRQHLLPHTHALVLLRIVRDCDQ